MWWLTLSDSRSRKTLISVWWSASLIAKWKLPATRLTVTVPSKRQPSPTCLRSSAIASLSSKTLGSRCASSCESSASERVSCSRAPAGSICGPCTASRWRDAGAAGVSSAAPVASSRVFEMLRIKSSAWLPDMSSVSRVTTEQGSAGKLMLIWMSSRCPRVVSTKRWSTRVVVSRSLTSMALRMPIRAMQPTDTRAPETVRCRNSLSVFGYTSNDESGIAAKDG
mmetsp:Transcript_40075/g.93547  ORF Transcript_40075/g.93547 Transcript_40075/m.93547 type:complete len:224 (+) Transcript_40075:662-1333(+)